MIALKETAAPAADAPPVLRKIHKKGTTADPLRGLVEATLGGRPAVVEYEPDPELRDSEQIPFLEWPACHAPRYLPTAEGPARDHRGLPAPRGAALCAGAPVKVAPGR